MAQNKTHLIFWKIACLASMINIGVFAVRLILAPHATTVQFIPDDGFYYLTLARNYSEMGQWSIDSGISVTSGFHPVLGYMLTWLYSILTPSPWNFVYLSVALTAGFSLLACGYILKWALKQNDILMLALITLAFSAPHFLTNATSITEWSLTLLISLLFTSTFIEHFGSKHTKPAVLIFLLGLIGSLTRSDFGLWPAALFAASVIYSFWSKKPKTNIWLPLWGLAGAGLGAAAGLAHNFLLTGSVFQSSAMVKAYWAKFSDDIGYTIAYLFFSSAGISGQHASIPRLGLILICILMIGSIIISRRGRQPKSPISEIIHQEKNARYLVLAAGSLMALGGYTFFYSLNGAVSPWYSVNLLIPLFVILYIFLTISINHFIIGRIKNIFSVSLYIMIGLVSLYNILGLQTFNPFFSPWPYQKYFLEAGLYLQEQELPGRVAAWNSGVIGYFQGGEVINLDGLVNNDIYAHMISNTIPTYLEMQQVRYVIDQEMTFHEYFSRRGGFHDPNFLKRLVQTQSFGDPSLSWNHIVLFEIRP